MRNITRRAFPAVLLALWLCIVAAVVHGWSLVVVEPDGNQGREHRFDLAGGASIHVAFDPSGGLPDAITTATSARGARSVRTEQHGIPLSGLAIAIDRRGGVALIRVPHAPRFPKDPIVLGQGTYVLGTDGSLVPAGIADRLKLYGADNRAVLIALAAAIAGLLVRRFAGRGKARAGTPGPRRGFDAWAKDNAELLDALSVGNYLDWEFDAEGLAARVPTPRLLVLCGRIRERFGPMAVARLAYCACRRAQRTWLQFAMEDDYSDMLELARRSLRKGEPFVLPRWFDEKYPDRAGKDTREMVVNCLADALRMLAKASAPESGSEAGALSISMVYVAATHAGDSGEFTRWLVQEALPAAVDVHDGRD